LFDEGLGMWVSICWSKDHVSKFPGCPSASGVRWLRLTEWHTL
jgi:hypothetical protein